MSKVIKQIKQNISDMKVLESETVLSETSEFFEIPKRQFQTIISNRDMVLNQCAADNKKLQAKLKCEETKNVELMKIFDKVAREKDAAKNEAEIIKRELEINKEKRKGRRNNDLEKMDMEFKKRYEESEKNKQKQVEELYEKMYKKEVDDYLANIKKQYKI